MRTKLNNINIQTALALSAASALIYEVVATNILFFYFIKSSYSIATVLSVFLLGLGIGSIIIYKIINKIINKKLLFGWIQIIISLYAFFILANLLSIIPNLNNYNLFLVSFAILLVPTIFLGAAFPLAGSIFEKRKNDIMGLVYSSDLAGAIIGAVLAGFILIPIWGNKAAILFGVGFNLLAALIILSKSKRLIPIIITVILLAIYFTPLLSQNDTSTQINNNSNTNSAAIQYQFYKNSPYGLIRVTDNHLYINERGQCNFVDQSGISERRMADYALNPLSDKEIVVLNIGLGCGGTLKQVISYPNVTAEVVEINPIVVEANRIFSDVLDSPNVNLIIDDGMNHLRNTDKLYQSVLIDIENPTIAHSSNLYTIEAFNIIADQLSDNGTLALWNYGGDGKNLQHYMGILFYSLKEALPYVYAYQGVFLASKQPLGQLEYEPLVPFEINTIDKNTLTSAFLEFKI